MTEEWKVYKQTQRTLWEVSNLANVKKNGKLYTCIKNISGYLVFGHQVYLHRVVAELFIGPIPEGYQVDHIDGNKENNCVTNLRIVTPKENMNNPITIKRISSTHKGENNPVYGKHWYTNGVEEVMAYSCPEGFTPGKIPKSA